MRGITDIELRDAPRKVGQMYWWSIKRQPWKALLSEGSHALTDGAGTAETTVQMIRAKTVAEVQTIFGDFIKTKNVPPGT